MRKIVDFILKNHAQIILVSFLIFVLIIVLGVILFPSIFYDNWIWKYYWGPVVADAGVSNTAVHNGVVAKEGYTLVSELTYGVMVIVALYGIFRLLKKLKIRVDWSFALALLPYILFGSVSRVLEDTGYFKPPLVYLFISPLIYMLIALIAVFFLLLGYFLEKRYDPSFLSVNRVLFIGGLVFLLPSLFLVGSWIFGYRWGETSGINFNVFLIVIFIISLAVLVVYFVSGFFKDKKDLLVYQNPLNLAMIFGHLMDGVTSYISIKDPFSMGLFYSEKHPASNFLLEIWGPLFPIVKFLLIIFVIYVFDILYKDELKNHMTLVNILKIGILILGFSPGLRDLLRVVMGV